MKRAESNWMESVRVSLYCVCREHFKIQMIHINNCVQLIQSKRYTRQKFFTKQLSSPLFQHRHITILPLHLEGKLNGEKKCAHPNWSIEQIYFCIVDDLVPIFVRKLPSNMQKWPIFCTRCFTAATAVAAAAALEQWHITGIDNKVFDFCSTIWSRVFHNEKGIIQMSSACLVLLLFFISFCIRRIALNVLWRQASIVTNAIKSNKINWKMNKKWNVKRAETENK